MRLNPYLAKSTVVAALGGLLFGFDTVVISGTTSGLTSAYSLSPLLKGLTVSAALWGTVAGSLLAAIPGDRYGRRDSLRLMAVIYFLSALGCAGAWSWASLVVSGSLRAWESADRRCLVPCTSRKSPRQAGADV